MLMSGRIQRALINIFGRDRDNAFTTEDLCDRIWPDLYQDQIKKSHHGAVIRAARHIASERPEVQWLYSQRRTIAKCAEDKGKWVSNQRV
jgi:hypothetical protein